jgi:hypothetical protein
MANGIAGALAELRLGIVFSRPSLSPGDGELVERAVRNTTDGVILIQPPAWATEPLALQAEAIRS